MNNYLWLVVIPKLGCILAFIGCGGIFLSLLYSGVFCIDMTNANSDKDVESAKILGKEVFRCACVSLFFLFVGYLIPSKQEIIQLKVLSVISDLKGVEQLPQKIIDRLNEVLEVESKDD